MFGVDDQKISDMEVAQGYWERMKDRMAWCRKEASEYLKRNERPKFYKLKYSDSGTVYETRAALKKEDIKIIRDAIAKKVEENGPFKDKKEEDRFLADYLSELDIDWVNDYLPARYQIFMNTPIVIGVDFDDYTFCCRFKVMHTNWYSETQEELVTNNYNIGITDGEFIELVAAKLFDQSLTFYDLKYLNEDLYRRIDNNCQTPHEHHIIFMSGINQAAKAILESKSKEELPYPVKDNMFAGVFMNIIFKNPDQFDDPQLIKALKLASND